MKQELVPRIETLSDGVFAIAATLLVLDVRVPHLVPGQSTTETWRALGETLPSVVAFAFSFLTILIYWLNHDSVTRALRHYPYRLKWLNLMFLLWISAIPFGTRFIAEYPFEPVSSIVYGSIMLMTALTAVTQYVYSAFWSDAMHASVDHAARKRVLVRYTLGPLLYFAAVLCAFVEVRASIAIYLGLPLLFFIPALRESGLGELEGGEQTESGE